jgi:uncharacterized protein (TIGR02117 family)
MKKILIFLYISLLLFTYEALGQEFALHDNKVRIFVHGGGVHSDIIVPLYHPTMNWLEHLETPLMKAGTTDMQWLSFGWGSKAFYLNTPRWVDVKVRDLVSAVVGTGGAAYHVIRMSVPVTGEHCWAIDLTIEQYQSLCYFLLSYFDSKQNIKPMIAYKPAKVCDVFYSAKGFYNALNNCNTWTNKALHSCGQTELIWALSYQQVLKALK